MPTERSGFNNLQVTVYNGLSTTPRIDAAGDLPRAEGITFSTQYPSGISGDAELFCPRDPTAAWSFAGNDRLVIRNGQAISWEGTISGIGYLTGTGAAQGRRIIGQGWWGTIMGKRGINKPWADNRVSEDVWPIDTTVGGSSVNKGTVDRLNRIRITPKAEQWINTEALILKYTMPTGASIQRVTLTDALQEVSQAWDIRFQNVTTGSALWFRQSSGSSNQNQSPGAPPQAYYLLLSAFATQSPCANGAYYGEVSNVMMYSTTVASVNACNIGLDVITQANTAAASPLNSYTGNVGNPAFTLEPFISNGYEPLADVLLRATGFGDATFNQWAAYLDHSETATTPNGKPVLVIEKYAALTDYDYAVRLDDPNVVPPLELTRNWDDLWNWIVVSYRDELNNRTVYLTPDDQAALKNAQSITDWGQREYVLDVGQSGSAMAMNAGQRFLAAKKDPKFYVAGPITVQGYIRGRDGNPIPSSLIRAGKRVKVENFLTSEVGVENAGLTFLISGTRYTDSDETCSISCGTPDDLAIFLAQLSRTVR